jgi:Zinc finger, C3HC4 type (RING finger)
MESVGEHNTYVALIAFMLFAWGVIIFRRIYEALKILSMVQPSSPLTPTEPSLTQFLLQFMGLKKPVRSSIVFLPQVNDLVDEFEMLNKRHLEQIILASTELRHPPAPAKQLRMPFDVRDVSYTQENGDIRVKVKCDVAVRSVMAAYKDFKISENEEIDHLRYSVRDSTVALGRWWIKTLFMGLTNIKIPHTIISEENPQDQMNVRINEFLEKATDKIVLSPGMNQVVNLTATRLSDAIPTSGNAVVPLLIAIAADSVILLNFCRLVPMTNRVEIQKQVYFPLDLQICGFYGLEASPQTVECMICCDRRVDTVLIPCCHCSLCDECAKNLRDGKCPMCRSIYGSYVVLPINSSSREVHEEIQRPLLT